MLQNQTIPKACCWHSCHRGASSTFVFASCVSGFFSTAVTKPTPSHCPHFIIFFSKCIKTHGHVSTRFPPFIFLWFLCVLQPEARVDQIEEVASTRWLKLRTLHYTDRKGQIPSSRCMVVMHTKTSACGAKLSIFGSRPNQPYTQNANNCFMAKIYCPGGLFISIKNADLKPAKLRESIPRKFILFSGPKLRSAHCCVALQPQNFRLLHCRIACSWNCSLVALHPRHRFEKVLSFTL